MVLSDQEKTLLWVAWLPLLTVSTTTLYQEDRTRSLIQFLLAFILAFTAIKACFHAWAVSVTASHKGPKDIHEMIKEQTAKAKSNGTNLKVAVVGTGISGVGALKRLFI